MSPPRQGFDSPTKGPKILREQAKPIPNRISEITYTEMNLVEREDEAPMPEIKFTLHSNNSRMPIKAPYTDRMNKIFDQPRDIPIERTTNALKFNLGDLSKANSLGYQFSPPKAGNANQRQGRELTINKNIQERANSSQPIRNANSDKIPRRGLVVQKPETKVPPFFPGDDMNHYDTKSSILDVPSDGEESKINPIPMMSHSHTGVMKSNIYPSNPNTARDLTNGSNGLYSGRDIGEYPQNTARNPRIEHDYKLDYPERDRRGEFSKEARNTVAISTGKQPIRGVIPQRGTYFEGEHSPEMMSQSHPSKPVIQVYEKQMFGARRNFTQMQKPLKRGRNGSEDTKKLGLSSYFNDSKPDLVTADVERTRAPKQHHNTSNFNVRFPKDSSQTPSPKSKNLSSKLPT